MLFLEYKIARIAELCKTPRCIDVSEIGTEHDYVRGLLELIQEIQPTSVLEIGSYRGVSTELFLLLAKRVAAVDPWSYPESIFAEFMERCGDYPNLEVYTGYSPLAVRGIKPEFDMCYIDGEHTYSAVRQDIFECVCKVRPHGWIAGHDFHMPEIERAARDALDGPFITFKDGSWATKRLA